jgi:alcohol dehydrogenase (cytochrome c)
MRARTRFCVALACAAIASAVIEAADYSLTVSQDRLNNAQNEPHNWLLMNGDYGSTRYSKLTQINRDTVRHLRMVWALALGGMQDVGQNGPESEVNPLIDNGYMYTTDGWGTIYKIDARDANRGTFVWVADPGVQHEGNSSRTRGIALWQDISPTDGSSRSTATTARLSGTRRLRARTSSAPRNASSRRRLSPMGR